jgi:hypothetical protein
MKRTSKVLLQAAVLIMALLLCGVAQAATRAVRAENMSLARGETNKLFVSFDTLGDEYAVSFTLCFDTNQLAFVGAVRASGVAGTEHHRGRQAFADEEPHVGAVRRAEPPRLATQHGLRSGRDPRGEWPRGIHAS